MPKNKKIKNYVTQSNNYNFHFKNIDVEIISVNMCCLQKPRPQLK